MNICLAVFSFYILLFSKHFFTLSCPEYRLCSFSFLGPHGVGVPLFSRLSLFHFALANAPLSSLWIFPVFCLWPWLSVYLSFPHLPTLCPPRTHNHTQTHQFKPQKAMTKDKKVETDVNENDERNCWWTERRKTSQRNNHRTSQHNTERLNKI